MAEEKFALIQKLVVLMKGHGVTDTAQFSALGSLSAAEIQERIAEYEASAEPVKLDAPQPKEKAEEEPKDKGKKKSSRRTVGGRKKNKKAEPVVEAPAPKAPEEQPAASPQAIDAEVFKSLMQEAIAPLSARVNALEDRLRMAVDKLEGVEDQLDSKATYLRKEVERIDAALKAFPKGGSSSGAEEESEEREAYKLLDLIARAAGYACDIIEGELEAE